MSAPNAWCPECGPLHRYDGRGCCPTCGSVCMGPGAEAALRALAEVKDLRARLKAVRSGGEPGPGYVDEAEAWERILRITDLRRKNWRRP